MSDHAHGGDSAATRFLGLVLGLVIIGIGISVHFSWHWSWHAVGIGYGILAVVLGAGGTSVHSETQGSILGIAGVTLFVAGLSWFFGLGKMLFGA